MIWVRYVLKGIQNEKISLLKMNHVYTDGHFRKLACSVTYINQVSQVSQVSVGSSFVPAALPPQNLMHKFLTGKQINSKNTGDKFKFFSKILILFPILSGQENPKNSLVHGVLTVNHFNGESSLAYSSGIQRNSKYAFQNCILCIYLTMLLYPEILLKKSHDYS